MYAYNQNQGRLYEEKTKWAKAINSAQKIRFVAISCINLCDNKNRFTERVYPTLFVHFH